MEITVREHHYTRSDKPARSLFAGYQTVGWTSDMPDTLLDALEKLGVHTFPPQAGEARSPVIGCSFLDKGVALSLVEITDNVDAAGRSGIQYARSVVLDHAALKAIDYDVLGLLQGCPELFSPRLETYPGIFEPRQVVWNQDAVAPPPCSQDFLARLIEVSLERKQKQRLSLATDRIEDALPILRAAWVALPRAWLKQIRMRSPVDQPANYTVDWNVITLVRSRLPAGLEGQTVLDATTNGAGAASEYALQAAAAVFAGDVQPAIDARRTLDNIERPVSAAAVDSARTLLRDLDQLGDEHTSDAFAACCNRLLALQAQGVSDGWLVECAFDLLSSPQSHDYAALVKLAPLAELDVMLKERWTALCEQFAPPPPPRPAQPIDSLPAQHSEATFRQLPALEQPKLPSREPAFQQPVNTAALDQLVNTLLTGGARFWGTPKNVQIAQAITDNLRADPPRYRPGQFFEYATSFLMRKDINQIRTLRSAYQESIRQSPEGAGRLELSISDRLLTVAIDSKKISELKNDFWRMVDAYAHSVDEERGTPDLIKLIDQVVRRQEAFVAYYVAILGRLPGAGNRARTSLLEYATYSAMQQRAPIDFFGAVARYKVLQPFAGALLSRLQELWGKSLSLQELGDQVATGWNWTNDPEGWMGVLADIRQRIRSASDAAARR